MKSKVELPTRQVVVTGGRRSVTSGMRSGGGASILVAAIAIVALAIGARALAAPAPRVIQIKATEFAFDPKEVSVKTGEVTFAVKNDGRIEHNFVIEDANHKTVAQIPVIEPGKTEDLKATLRTGTFTYVCNLPGHKEAGMHGPLRVQP